MTFNAWNLARLLLAPALGLALVAAVQVDSTAAEPTPAAAQPGVEAKPVMIRSAQTCGTNHPVCGNHAACPATYPTCIDAAGGCYCHGSGTLPASPKPAPH